MLNAVTMNSHDALTWSVISVERIIGPHILENVNVFGESYKNMLTRYPFPGIPHLQQGYIVQQDCAVPYYSNGIREYLKIKRPGNCIGRGGPVS